VCEVTAFGGPEVLELRERPLPVPKAPEVLVEIEAANVNPSDLAARAGAHRHRLPDLHPPFVPADALRDHVERGGLHGRVVLAAV
jgi:NADPH2:quinone reductase